MLSLFHGHWRTPEHALLLASGVISGAGRTFADLVVGQANRLSMSLGAKWRTPAPTYEIGIRCGWRTVSEAEQGRRIGLRWAWEPNGERPPYQMDGS